MTNLAVNDPVHVERESQQFEGVVAYIGSVDFADGSDWVGVRLTGSSVGLGKNDGTVQGTNYFSCAPNGGLFVRAAVVTKRTLSRLEELRLKRELAAAKREAAEQKLSSTTKSSRAVVGSTVDTSATTTAPSTLKESPKKSRIEELRARREALAADRSSNPSDLESSRANTPDPQDEGPRSSANDASSSDEVKDLHDKLANMQSNLSMMESNMEQLSSKLKAKEEETASLQQSLSKAEQDVHDRSKQVQKLESQLQDKFHDPKNLEVSSFNDKETELQDTIDKLNRDLVGVRQELERERETRSAEVKELVSTRASLATLQHELDALNDQTASRTSSDASHYKERAKLQAEMAALKRTNEQLEAEKMDMEATLEDLTLDKEQLLEEKESLQDRVDELNIDAETAQMEVEEMRLELEDAKKQQEGGMMSADVEDAAQAVAAQNARLREALIRLREQSSFEKVEMSRQLRSAEKAVNEYDELKKELESLRIVKKSLDEEVAFLKETIDQSSAFESMVEDLSDRVMMLEDDNVALQSTLREMEDAADVASELEEVQAEEVKALMMDLEGRDFIIRNLEEAIKMQRRREEDFQRTVVNYRNSVETLKQEKNQLLAMQRGGEGEKSEMMATSQKALARAAQLVADAANARKREAEHAFKLVDSHVQLHLSERLESMLPHTVVSAELAAIKGELLLCKVVGKASMTLEGLASTFSKTIRTGTNEATATDEYKGEVSASFEISDETAQDIERVLHETQFSLTTIDMSTELLRLLAAGQWPDVMSTDMSAQLGSAFIHTLSDLDANMGSSLKILKEEGSLSPHRSNLGAFQQSVQTSAQALKSARSLDDKPLVPNDWQPPAWQVLKDVSIAKFNCLGAGAAMAAILCNDQPESGEAIKSCFKSIMTKMEQVATETTKIGPRLGHLDVSHRKVVTELEGMGVAWKASSEYLVECITALFADKSVVKVENISLCEVAAETALKATAQFMSALRAADLHSEDGSPHPLSCECQDTWSGMSFLTKRVRSIDGDEDDVNFVVRSASIEQQLLTAIENEPKLTSANNRIATLEKNLSSRSKEIAMQNARLSELEKLLAKSNVQAPTRAQTSATVTEELMKLKEENRVLNDAMDVMQQQVDEYEAEMRALKDPKSPKGRASRMSSARSLISPGQAGTLSATPAELSALQASMFRPALESIRREASTWKANAVAKDILGLPPLSIPGITVSEVESKDDNPNHSALEALDASRSALRLEKASFRLVDLSLKTPRAQLLEALSRSTLAEEKVRKATALASSTLSKRGIVSAPGDLGSLLGRITFSGESTLTKIPLAMTKDDMMRMHLQLIH